MRSFIVFMIVIVGISAAAWQYLTEHPQLESDLLTMIQRLPEIDGTGAPSATKSNSGDASNPAGTSPPLVAAENSPESLSPPPAEKSKRETLYNNFVAGLKDIERRRGILDQNKQISEEKAKSLKKERIKLGSGFKEQTEEEVLDDDGIAVGTRNRGIRTSDADRKKKLAPIVKQIEDNEQFAAAVEQGYDQLEREKSNLERKYSKEKAKLPNEKR